MSAGAGDPPFGGGRRKDGRPFAKDNVGEDGSYIVGRNRPPQAGKFSKGDGRPRGRRKQGVENVDSFFDRELGRKVTVREDGKERKVTKSNSIDMRLIQEAAMGDIRAIELVDARRRRIEAKREEHQRRFHRLSDHEILQRYLLELSAERAIDPSLFGDPPLEDAAGDDGASDSEARDEGVQAGDSGEGDHG